MSSLTLYIPHLNHEQHRAIPAVEGTVAQVCRHAKRSHFSPRSFEASLAQLFGWNDPLPAAQLLAAFDQVAVGEKVICADPINLHTDFSGAFLTGNHDLALTIEESQALITSLNEFLQQDGLQIVSNHPLRWYLSYDAELSTHTLTSCLGRNVVNYPLTGADALQYQKLLTEMQMLLFRHPVNEQRRESQQPEVNSLWFWGEGELSKPTHQFDRVMTNNDLVKSIAKYLDMPCGAANTLQINSNEHVLCVLDDFLTGENLGNEAVILTLINEWVLPAQAMLKDKQLDSCELILGNGVRYRLNNDTWIKWFGRIFGIDSRLRGNDIGI